MREEVIDSAGSGAAKGAASTTKEALASLEREAELVAEERWGEMGRDGEV